MKNARVMSVNLGRAEGGEWTGRVGRSAIRKRSTEEPVHVLRGGLSRLLGKGVVGFRARGLWAGVDIDPALGTGREVSARLMRKGVLVKDTHGSTIRLAPPLTITGEELEGALGTLAEVLTEGS